ncbi:MAG: hypothetical protein HN742_08920 [Lentisphaerae bacterium]|jgi:hypothetical protein|nr:hypothetical protein [Lentisphaerota bacterium]MBT5611153.1 hypothetical protein [Lentisphaerota bacterium]MBT7054723.1 hypothetical protein [Lentisphaerota bacterium]MBT7841981.1 hypothetical protein [Lentisphaerota bacterium]
MNRHLALLSVVLIMTGAADAAQKIDLDTWQLRYNPVVTLDSLPTNTWCEQDVQRHHIITMSLHAAPGAGTIASVHFCAHNQSDTINRDTLHSFELQIDYGASTLRLYRNPGHELTAEDTRFNLRRGETYRIAIVKHGRRMRVFVDGVPACEWWAWGESGNEKLDYAGGQVGVFTENVDLTISDFLIGQTLSLQTRKITELKDPRHDTDLSRASIAVGEAPAHREAAAMIADALAKRTGTRPDIVSAAAVTLPNDQPLIVIGNMADNAVVRTLYMQWYTHVDRAFPGEDGYLIQTVADPWGAGANIVLVGASTAAGTQRGAKALVAQLADGAVIGWTFDAQPAAEFARLVKYGTDEWDFYEKEVRQRLVLPYGWPQAYALIGPPDTNPQTPGLIFLMTGSDAHMKQYHDVLLTFVDDNPIVGHLYQPSHMILWDLLEEHPIFTDDERLTITNWFLANVRSREAIGASHIQRWTWGMPHQNHGTRPALGTFFMARYFDRHYDLPEMRMYSRRIAQYFDMQADWSKPMEDSSMHQWLATLTAKGIYAMTSGNMRFFESGAARLVAERALRTMNNGGVFPLIGDTGYGEGACTLLTQAALYYNDGRYLWPMFVRADWPKIATDELARSFVGDVEMRPPDDIVGVSVCPYDRGFWNGWRNLPKSAVFHPPNVSYEQAFDKIALRTGLGERDQFMLIEGMVGASHDYEDTNAIHEFSVGDRTYITTCDGLFSPTMAQHNGINVIRDGLASPLPYFAQRLHTNTVGSALVSQTRLNDFSHSDWTRTVVLMPDRYFVLLDQVEARKAGEFAMTGHWRTLGRTQLYDDGELTVRQWPESEQTNRDNTTSFHLQVLAGRSTWERLGRQYAINARHYRYAGTQLSNLEFGDTQQLDAGQSAWLYSLGHETGRNPARRYNVEAVAGGVVAVEGDDGRELIGAPRDAVTIGSVTIDADVFLLTTESITVVGGRRIVVGNDVLLDADEPVDRTLALTDVSVADALSALAIRPDRDSAGQAATPLPAQWRFDAGGKINQLRTFLGNPGAGVMLDDRRPLPDSLGIVAVATEAGHVIFLNRKGNEVHRVEADAPVNDVVVDDIDGDGTTELLLARHDSTLQCVNEDGTTRFLFQPAKERATNSMLQLATNSATQVFTANTGDIDGKLTLVSTGDQRLHAVEPNGNRRWMFWSYAGLFTTQGLYDLDGDGDKEVIGGNGRVSSADPLFFLDDDKPRNDGFRGFTRRILNDGWGATLSSMAIADFDGDGTDEIAIGTGKGNLHLIDPHQTDGPIRNKPEYRWTRQLGDDVRAMLAIEAAGRPLIVAASLSGFVVTFDANGDKQWSTSLDAPVYFLDAFRVDGSVRLIAALKDGGVVVLNQAGEIVQRGHIGAIPTTMAIADQLVAVATGDGVVHAFAVSGN